MKPTKVIEEMLHPLLENGKTSRSKPLVRLNVSQKRVESAYRGIQKILGMVDYSNKLHNRSLRIPDTRMKFLVASLKLAILGKSV